jgi:2-(1,2-epoxy-1,2-dihydrophenyl)acetyl-CoA isomerase
MEKDIGPELGSTTGGQQARTFVVGPDATIYVLLQKGFAVLDPETRELKLLVKSPVPVTVGGDILERGNRCILRLRALGKPVLGSINGDAVGIGCSLALATDLRIASDAARFGVVFSRIGLGPDGGASHLLREQVGAAKALELLFTGDLVDAPEALRLGLVNQVVPADGLADATRELAERLARGPTLAHGAAKAAVYESARLSFESLLDLEARNQRIVSRSEDVEEGIRAFLERRKPEFRGR